ncbi:MAG: Fructose-bisphosphate aldolase [candidate division TM6 bacterium GW2011_GWF2_37_49]|nr:MAG: Fructose-bisphosphate aldolase [candidate division TM6 bacterium GW2011_GWF2_37_49]
MIEIKKENIKVPLTVPPKLQETYIQNFLAATKNTGRLFLFAGDQKIEHLNQDFYGPGISPDDADPKHMFEIAKHGNVGVFATHLGLIARYGQNYKDVKYLVKLNAKTNLVSKDLDDPMSFQIHTVDQVAEFKQNSGLKVLGVGYTLYLGSKYESQMLSHVAQVIWQAHQHGMLSVIWIYPRGKSVKDELSGEIIAGACGVGLGINADFVKVNPPLSANSFESAKLLKHATIAAGRTKIVCSGGTMKNQEDFLTSLYHQLHTGGTSGIAVGRNLHQRNLDEAVAFCNRISDIIYNDAVINIL